VVHFHGVMLFANLIVVLTSQVCVPAVETFDSSTK